ncbi:MAG: trypsin-like peptidase domain-containing protein [Planctomycetes bacterium]|nr:trypsin-like peptidase domain-containing protein [Planctomycetota bacterium]MCB9904998.1 trypsin-like peptidase domain-containing protein [Planctomycetota bacterium]
MDKRLFVLIGLSLLAGIGLTQLPRLDAQPTGGPPVRTTNPGVAAVMRQVAELEQRLEDSQVEVERLRKRQARMAELGVVLEDLECRLAETRSQLLADQQRTLTEASLREDVEARLDERIAALNEGIESRWSDLQEAVFETQSLAEAASGRVSEVQEREEPDRSRMWAELMGPTVQLAGESTVGSGVLLRSREQADGTYRTHLLTAWHVVRDILSDADGLERPIPVSLYAPHGEPTHDTATLLEFDPTLDVALLVMNSDKAYTYGASLPNFERLEKAGVFDPIYAVGCPLGNDPIPTYGEVADTEHKVGDEAYWMISAPTYIGNSGGGIFDARTHELLGIFSKIYTHGNLRPTVVPHMGLVTPMDRIYDWLGEVGYAELEPQPGTPRALTASAER